MYMYVCKSFSVCQCMYVVYHVLYMCVYVYTPRQSSFLGVVEYVVCSRCADSR